MSLIEEIAGCQIRLRILATARDRMDVSDRRCGVRGQDPLTQFPLSAGCGLQRPLLR
jgi:hypothetical protein